MCRAAIAEEQQQQQQQKQQEQRSVSLINTAMVPTWARTETTRVRNALSAKRREILSVALRTSKSSTHENDDPISREAETASRQVLHSFDTSLVSHFHVPVAYSWRRNDSAYDPQLADEAEARAVQESWGGGGSGNVMRPIVALSSSSSSSSSSSKNILPLVSRAWEEKWMRAPVSKNEPSCSKNESCQCALLSNNDFCGVVFQYPDGQWSPTDLCLLCIRYEVTQFVLTRMMTGRNAFEVKQPHRNSVGKNEYGEHVILRRDARNFYGITDPFVKFHRLDYVVVERRRISHTKIVDWRASS